MSRTVKKYHKYIRVSSVDDDKKTYENIVEDMLDYVKGRLIQIEVVETWCDYNSSEESITK